MKQRKDTGVAGLTILLSLVTMLFVIGLLVMIFVIMSGQLQQANYDSATVTSVNESTATNAFPHGLDGLAYRNSVCGDITRVINNSNFNIGVGNFSQSSFTSRGDNCVVSNTTTVTQWGTAVKITYSYTYEADNTATTVMNDTGSSISSVTDWFDIFIVIGAMVVLILLTVIIITSIRSSGMVDGGNRANNVGTA